MFTNYDSAFGPLQSSLVRFISVQSIMVNFNPFCCTYLKLGEKKGLDWEFYIAINYLSNIHCNYMISFNYHDNLLKRIKNLNNIFET